MEEKLAKEQEDRELKFQKSRSKSLQLLRKKELDAYETEARELIELVSSGSETQSDTSYRSLEWDSDRETTSPSFAKDFVVNLTSGISQEEIEGAGNSTTKSEERKNTSTDGTFLDEYPLEVVGPISSGLWPPRFPSQEPDTSLVENYKSLSVPNLDSFLEVFEDVSHSSSMDQQVFNAKLREVKLAEMQVKDEMKTFTPDKISELDLATYQDRLSQIRSELGVFNGKVSEIIVDFDDQIAEDNARKTSLEERQAKLLEEVMANERAVKAEIKRLCEEQPLSPAETRQIENESKKAEAIKVDKVKRLQNAEKNISKKTTELQTEVDKLKAAKDLSDSDVRQVIVECQSLDRKLVDLDKIKVKFDDDVIGFEGDIATLDEINKKFDDLCLDFKNKYADYRQANQERSLYALSKPVKEVAAYPVAFS